MVKKELLHQQYKETLLHSSQNFFNEINTKVTLMIFYYDIDHRFKLGWVFFYFSMAL